MLKDTKYLIAYLLPLSCWFGLQNGGYWSPGAFYLAFGILPLFELFLPKSTDNVSAETEEKRSSTFIFDVLLWSNVPIVYGLLYFLFHQIQSGNISGWEIPFAILNVGMVTGSCGINVAHELGHRSNKFEQFLSKTLLLTELYMHFFIEHNLGHHKNVATDADPASSRLGESLYAFWFRSVKDSWFGAWKIEMQRLEKATISFWKIGRASCRERV